MREWVVTLGAFKSVDEYRAALVACRVEITENAHAFLSTLFISPVVKEVRMVESSLEDLGLEHRSPYEKILKRVREIGGIVPPEAIFARHVQFPRGNLYGPQFAVIEPIEIDGTSRVLVTNDVNYVNSSLMPHRTFVSHQRIGATSVAEAGCLDITEDGILLILPD
ncbi:hypothetical protein A3C09_03310 [Candidatus Uhrbacteria bacterium RIFCSPHIGHO2_02_FULL_47_44]|uniref:Uncharacterized protein n=1 Tax=Candidatus Uhrbacteria bacterium RIFCSPLOWO2_02_FULL_48_18 TaxID=1802408 RepID=A0A1F7V7Z3_9BACT|nr:MAG: hypothetical protein A2839_03295 [Candidatus Uhrbacteria bacterium RIFCSPHIGHO2_01_FULL_47_10]OGL70937.1 MAG: hypothetical protein A3C09_03310 [Candidatus Uhrbacteria bacterium RIFCSPHIGHO2_02_FULL_47_44]OGL80738.1 MAG: hypothetical protein A3B20_05110 [Candidatus Uhrbacteria bacterium RIFCSPLOWO2_01_FULL_47_17]OGL86610.1 MAG: hypothetical protein A3I41_04990 [Candidatus Uhrbacteria bacterium RIFCSPLOWO2_02_FULL_48_18]OGL92893.1 MAG: hypothetical protein A3H12_02195 [Candidatus Uhrbacte